MGVTRPPQTACRGLDRRIFGGSDPGVTAPDPPRRLRGSRRGCPAAPRPTHSSLRPVRLRSPHSVPQLTPILTLPALKPACPRRETPQVRDPYPPLGRFAPPCTRPQTPAKQGFSYARAKWLATPCEAIRQAAAHFATIGRNGFRSLAGHTHRLIFLKPRPERCLKKCQDGRGTAVSDHLAASEHLHLLITARNPSNTCKIAGLLTPTR